MRNPPIAPHRRSPEYTADNTTPPPWGGPVTLPNRYEWPPLGWWAEAARQSDAVHVHERAPDGALNVTEITFEPELLPTLAVKALRLRVLDGHGEVVAVASHGTDAVWPVDIMAARHNFNTGYKWQESIDLELTELFTDEEISHGKLWLKHNA